MPHNIILNDGDTVTEAQIRTLLGRPSVSGYIEDGGVDVTYYDSDYTVDVSAGNVHILDNLRDITIETDAFVGHGLVADAVNHLWITVDPAAATDDNAVSLVSNATGVGPSNPSIKIAEVDTTLSGSQAVDPRSRGTAAAVEGESVNLGGLELFDSAVQTSLDGYVVAVAPGAGVNEAIHATDRQTPVQDAVAALETVGVSADGRFGAGEILLPPGTIDSPGGIAGLAGKTIRGHGVESSVLRCTDPETSLFAVGGAGSNRRYAYLTGFTLDGGDRAARTAGSAISGTETSTNTLTESMTGHGFNLGRLQFRDWGGPDSVIASLDSFSSQWEYIRGEDYDGSFYRGGGFDLSMGYVNLNHDTFDTPVIDLEGPKGPVYLPSLNVGGNVGRGLRLDKSFSRHVAFHAGHINLEPDASGGGTLTSALAPIELLGASPASIQSISQDERLTSDYTVVLGGSINYSSANNDGPGRNRIGDIIYEDATSTNATVGVTASPRAVSWFRGLRSDIDFRGHEALVVPMHELGSGARTAFGSAYVGTSLSSGVWTGPQFNNNRVNRSTDYLNAGTNGYIAPEEGWYRITASLRFASGASGSTFFARAIKNGTPYGTNVAVGGSGATYTTVTGTWTVGASPGDTLAVQGQQNTGGSVQLDGTSTFFVEKVYSQ